MVIAGYLELISAIIHAEYTVTIANRYTSRLTKAKLKGDDNCFDQCIDSKERQYQLQEIIRTLSSLDFIRDGMNLCIFGAFDSGKPILQELSALKHAESTVSRTIYGEELINELVAVRKIGFTQYQKKVKTIVKLDLVILDDFFLHPITENDEVKALYDVMKKGMNCQGTAVSSYSVSQGHNPLC